jgi:hypothetical protein
MNTLARTESAALQAAQPQHIGGQALTLESAHLTNMMAIANMMASARATVPAHFKNSPGDCLAVVMQSARWGMDPFAVAQKTHLVQGTLGYEAQLVASVVNSSNITKDRMHFEWFGTWEKIIGKFKKVESKTKKDDDGHPKTYIVPAWEMKDEEGLGVRVWATLRGEDSPRELTLMMTQARTRNSGLWTEDPKQQLAYLAQKRWARLYAPDVLLGVYTPDEIEERAPRDMGQAEVIPPAGPVASDELRKAASDAAAKGVAAYQQFWKDAGTDNRKALAGDHEANKAAAIAADQKRTVDNPPAAETQAPAANTSAPATDGPTVTYAVVMDKLVKAKNLDALDVAADWIGEVADPTQRAELSAKYEELKKWMQG